MTQLNAHCKHLSWFLICSLCVSESQKLFPCVQTSFQLLLWLCGWKNCANCITFGGISCHFTALFLQITPCLLRFAFALSPRRDPKVDVFHIALVSELAYASVPSTMTCTTIFVNHQVSSITMSISGPVFPQLFVYLGVGIVQVYIDHVF